MIGTIVHSCASRLTTVSSSETSVTTANKVHPLGFLISDHIFLRNLKIRVLIIKILIIFQFIGNLSLGPEVFKIAKRRMGRGGGGREGTLIHYTAMRQREKCVSGPTSTKLYLTCILFRIDLEAMY